MGQDESVLINNFKVIYDQEDSKTETDFPNEFSVSFNEFQVEFNTKFVIDNKMLNDQDIPNSSNNIYIIDQETSNPIQHNTQSQEAIHFFFRLKQAIVKNQKY